MFNNEFIVNAMDLLKKAITSTGHVAKLTKDPCVTKTHKMNSLLSNRGTFFGCNSSSKNNDRLPVSVYYGVRGERRDRK